MTRIGRSVRRVGVAVPDAHGRLELGWGAVTDTGHRRERNEDSLIARAPIFAVADGMGGHEAGETASSAVVARLSERLGTDFLGSDDIEQALRAAVADMLETVGRTELGTGTTVTGFALTLVDGEPHWLVFNIGDSRVYQLVAGELEQLTVDHSIVQELLDAGLIRPDEVDTHPHSNVITRAVGFNEDPVPDYWLVPVVTGARMLVCSDGLTKELTDHGIEHFLSEASTAEEAAQDLLDASLRNGGRDNITVVVVDVLRVPEAASPRRFARRR